MAPQAPFTDLWYRATQRFPELAEQWGAELPEDDQRKLQALNAYSALLKSRPAKTTEAPWYKKPFQVDDPEITTVPTRDERRFRPDVTLDIK